MRKLLLLLLFVAVGTQPALAQSEAFTTVLDHLQARSATLGVNAADFADAAVTDEYTSRTSGATHVYLRQTAHGIEVFNALASAHVTPEGRVVGVHSTFVPDVAERAGTPAPSLSAGAAVEAAAQQLGLVTTATPAVLEAADERHRLLLSDAGVSLSPIPVQLVYFVTEDGALRLAWDLSIEQRDAQHWWSVRVDAETGLLLDQHDWVVQDAWERPEGHVPADVRPVAPEAIVAARGGDTYHVWAAPVESPSHGPRSLVVNPADPTASPDGWHDDGVTSYTTTRGNNVYAYEDRNNANVPGSSPDGGAGLLFDFEIDLETQVPEEYQDAAITNLFYWNNIVHDVLVHYGFDETAGNFQRTNHSGQGAGNDYVRAEAQDGSGMNNANFATPPDGQPPRMQMYEWEGSTGLTLTAPEEAEGNYATGLADFGDPWPVDFPVTEIVPVISVDGGDYPGGEPDLDLADRACGEIFNTDQVEGKIAMIERGDCDFALKVWNAQQAGAIAAIIHNNSRTGPGETGSPNDISGMTHTPANLPFDVNDLVIPSVFVAQSTGVIIFENQPTEGYVRGALNRDSDLDAGVIVHEYGHGISNRLTGGPSAASCLQNQEQMGEGWSDYYGLMLTMNEEDTAEMPRGVGTYLSFEDRDGVGIRTYPYSTDMAVNDHTYNDIRTQSVPHGVGSVWAVMLWEMTWNLIDEAGFDPDLVGGTGGNNIALQLVTEGMKLQPCSPGFVDGRDAILAADTLLYDGAYSDAIWRGFAKRGLGYSASQGSSGSVMDGTEAFDLPPNVAGEDEATALPNGYRLSAAYPNPFTTEARFTLEVTDAQPVSVTVYDVMGREVARLHDGLLAAGSRHAFTVDGASLAAGVYLVRVTGRDFAETRRVTLLR